MALPLLMRAATLYPLNVVATSASTASVSGSVQTSDTGVMIEWGTASSPTFDNTFAPTLSATGTFTEALTGLMPGTKYKLMLERIAGGQESPASQLYSFSTPAATASPAVAALGSDTATISATTNTGQPASVYYGTTASDLSTPAPMTIVNGIYTAQLTGLTPTTTYFYSIRSTDGSLSYLPQNPYTFTTLQASTPATVKTIVDTVGTFGSGTGVATPSSGLVACGNPGQPDCTFADVMKLINSGINFVIFYLVPTIATAMIMYAGFLILTANGSVEKVQKAKGLMLSMLVGVIIITGAWLLIKGILISMGFNSANFPTFY